MLGPGLLKSSLELRSSSLELLFEGLYLFLAETTLLELFPIEVGT